MNVAGGEAAPEPSREAAPEPSREAAPEPRGAHARGRGIDVPLRTRTAAIIGAIVLLDYLTKFYIRAMFAPFDVYPVIPRVFNIVHTENPGAAFGMLADYGPWRAFVLVGVSVIMLGVIGYLMWKPHTIAGRGGLQHSELTQVALALVFAGALGNVWDRLFRGTVTDFLQVFIGSYEFPSFNAADSAITIGACLLIIDLWRTRRHRDAE
jgi:signal peptidase II